MHFFSYLRVDIELVHETKVQPLVAAVGGRIEILLLLLRRPNVRRIQTLAIDDAYPRGPRVPGPVSSLVDSAIEEVREDVEYHVHHTYCDEDAVPAFI